MPVKRKKSKNKSSINTGAIVTNAVGNYEEHPFFVKKANAAKAFLKIAGLPKELQKKP